MIYVVTGAPRSGKSMVMQILQAGGVELTYDENYLKPSSFNENGFFEYDKPGDLLCDPDFRKSIDGKAINVVSHELLVIPYTSRKTMRVIYVKRPLKDIYASMNRTVQEGILGGYDKEVVWESFINTIASTLKRVEQELRSFESYKVVEYDNMIESPKGAAMGIGLFVNYPNFNFDKAAQVPEARLRHFQGGKDAR